MKLKLLWYCLSKITFSCRENLLEGFHQLVFLMQQHADFSAHTNRADIIWYMYIQVCLYSYLHVIHGLNAALYVTCTIAFPLILNVVGQTIFYFVFADVLYRKILKQLYILTSMIHIKRVYNYLSLLSKKWRQLK